MPDGNEAQVRIISEQLFEQWERRQSERRKPITMELWLGIASMVLSVSAIIWQAAVTTQRVNDAIRRIEAIEAFGLDKNFARLEAKVDLLLEERNRRISHDSSQSGL